MNKHFDAIVIGGGFYGCCLAVFLKKYYDKILIIEKETDLLKRASSKNQARIHSGFHYPRNLVTAFRSFINYPRFITDFRKCIYDEFDKIYAVARSHSKVNAYQFMKTFKNLGIPIKTAPAKYQKLFNQDMIDDVFLVKEVAFDPVKLKEIIKERLNKEGVDVCYDTEVYKIEQLNGDQISLSILNEDLSFSANKVYNCTYSQINNILRNSNVPILPLKHEVTELALIEVPDELRSLGVTVMDGPFFSTMPYPSTKLHTLSHVRYTPHYNWSDIDNFIDGHAYLKNTTMKSNYIYMVKDAKRYFPLIEEAQYVDSLYEIKTVLVNNEIDDGRPILLKKDYYLKNLSIIMGSKIDNIYDVLSMLIDKSTLGRSVA